MGNHQGRWVAAKVLRINLTSDLERIRKVPCPRSTVSPNELTSSDVELLQGSRDVGDPPPSECTPIIRRGNVRESVRDGVGVDGKRERQQVYEGSHRCESIGARIFFVR